MRAPHPEQIQHAHALLAKGWEPDDTLPTGEILATVRRGDYRQHVEPETWAAMHLMCDLPVLGEVKAGNPEIQRACPAALGDLTTGKGVLNRVRGSFVAEACAKLKPARGAAQEEQARVTMDVPDVGLVEFTFKSKTYRHGRSRHWHWIAVRADLVQP